MSVVTATNLRKELSGDPLFDGVSFKVERRDRVSLSGPNGAGKTTLLRILNGETELHGGKLSLAKGTRIALHDQRPPAESGASLRDYVLSGAADLTAAEGELRRLEEAMAAGDHEPATLRALLGDPGAAGARGRLRLARAARLGHAQPRLLVRRPRAPALDVLRRRADARLARARARRRSRPPAARRADEPPRRREPRMARARAAVDRRRGDPRRARPLVPRGGDDGGARARGRPLDLLRRALAQLAPREGGAPGRGDDGRTPRRRRHRPARAFRRALPRQEESREARTGEADADRAAREGAGRGPGRDLAAHAPREEPRLRVPAAEAKRPDGRRGRRRGARRGRQGAPVRTCRSRSSAASTSPWSGRTAPARRRSSRRSSAAASPWPESSGSGTASRPRTSRSTRSSSTRAGRCSRSRRTRPGCSARRRRTSSADSSSPAGRCTSGRCRCSPAASGAGWRSRSSSRRARTCSCSTSPPTTSTSRAARRSRLRSTRSRARCCSSPTIARCSTGSPTGRSRSRTERFAPTRAAGRSTLRPGTRGRRRPVPSLQQSRRRRRLGHKLTDRGRPSSSYSKRISRAAEAEIAELERKLAEDWANVDVVAAHRRARDELQSLLIRWEQIFERSQA